MRISSTIPFFVLAGAIAVGIALTAPAAPPAAVGAAATGSPTTAPGYAALAARLGALSRRVMQVSKVGPGNLKMAAALLEAAQRMDPTEPRYPRQLVDVLAGIRDDANANQERMVAAQAFRKLQPEDRPIQLTIVDLYLSQIQAAEKKEAYLNDLLGRMEIHPEVRSGIALRLADVLGERKSEDEVLKAVRESLRLNPLNLEALQREFALTVRSATQPVERVRLVTAMLRSNPNQANVMVDLAQQLADLGLTDESLLWFAQGKALVRLSHSPEPPEYAARYAMEAFIADQTKTVADICDYLMEATEDVTAPMLRLMQEMRKDDKPAAAKYRAMGHNILVNKIQQVRGFLGVKGATTQPTGGEVISIPDLSDDAALLGGSENKEVQRAQAFYIDTLQTLAWFEVYFDESPDEAKKITDFLEKVLKPGNPTLARTVGWIYLIKGDTTAAKQKLSAVADRDPLAGMGLLRLSRAGAADAAELDAAATRLMTASPSGLMGAILWNEFHPRQIKLVPRPEAESVRAELRKFPVQWLKILDQPQNFYLVKAEPLKVSFAYGEPVMARVTVQNIGNDDITVGPLGLIRPELGFDANIPQLKDATPQPMQGVAGERLWQQGVLHPKQSITQNVRLDDGSLWQVFMQTPTMPLSLSMTIRTNWAVAKGNVIVSMPGGLNAPFERAFERAPFLQTADEFRKAEAEISGGTDEQKIRRLDLINTYLQIIRAQIARAEKEQANMGTLKEQAMEFDQAIRGAMSDPDAPVRFWARYSQATSGSEETRALILKRMLSDPDWASRLVGMTGVFGTPPEKWKAVVGPLTADPEPLVRRMASGMVEFAAAALAAPADAGTGRLDPPRVPATQESTTRPTTQEAPIGPRLPTTAP